MDRKATPVRLSDAQKAEISAYIKSKRPKEEWVDLEFDIGFWLRFAGMDDAQAADTAKAVIAEESSRRIG